MSRTEKRKLGDRGERRTALYLILRGYRVLERNYTYGHKEVDIIAKRRGFLAFVEVKTRTDPAVAPSASVTAAKRSNIISAAKAYCRSHDTAGLVIRFDVAEVTDSGGVNYIENAFSGQ